jgi:hypothetical protein
VVDQRDLLFLRHPDGWLQARRRVLVKPGKTTEWTKAGGR